MKENGEITIDMVTVCRDGKTGHDMKVNGKIIELTDKESSSTLMVMFLTDNGLMIKQRDSDHIFMLTEQDMKESGKRIYKTVKD